MRRRSFLQSSSLAALSALLPAGRQQRRPRVLLRSSWQVVNIGDIAHTPGVLALLERHIPDAEVRLWASPDISDAVMAMEHRRFPALRIVTGTIGPDGQASNAELGDAIGWCDFLLHGSGPALVGARDVAAFAKVTGKPYGVYGITHGSFLSGPSATDVPLLSQSRFAFFRDSVSLSTARAQGVSAPVMGLAPDGAFACDLRDDAAAASFLAANGLVERQFVCVIPRLRYTPYWRIRNVEMTDESRRRAARNDAMAEHDHAPLRNAIIAVVRSTPLKVLVCPEDVSQMAVGKEWIVDRLPDDARRRVVWRERFWLTDEALSTYARSVGLFGLEMHSPIMCIGNGVPAIVCRFEEQTSKGIMWRDIGLGDWLFDFDRQEDIDRIVPAVLRMLQNRDETAQRVSRARDVLRVHQQETMEVVARSLAAARPAVR